MQKIICNYDIKLKIMETRKIEEVKNTRGVIVDGVEYFNQAQATKMAGVSIPTFKKKVELFNIPSKKQQNGRQIYAKSDIITAIENGWFNKWWM